MARSRRWSILAEQCVQPRLACLGAARQTLCLGVFLRRRRIASIRLLRLSHRLFPGCSKVISA